MSNEHALLALTAAGLGFLHALLGPDHYLPFVLLARAGRWSRAKTLAVTLACGVGHVASSLALAAVGMGLGVAATRLEALESFRGRIAVWGLIAFGLVYFVWGLRQAERHRPHRHLHLHPDGTVHAHPHVHEGEHLHVHTADKSPGPPVTRMPPLVLFTIFVFGPCEPLIPLVLVPAAQQSLGGVALVTALFSLTTLATMAVAVVLCQAGLERVRLGRLERYTQAMAGAALALCGLALHLFSF
ncbi:MAG: hypothetical protein HY656_06090 [Acidobacteria bacterium]|nr:hypothetical protein [Acidobacteriota bacterium]